MTISKKDYIKLCEIAAELNEDDSYIELWRRLIEVIENIEE